MLKTLTRKLDCEAGGEDFVLEFLSQGVAKRKSSKPGLETEKALNNPQDPSLPQRVLIHRKKPQAPRKNAWSGQLASKGCHELVQETL